MNKNINRRRYFSLFKINFIYYLFTLIFLISFFVLYSQNKKIDFFLNKTIEDFSKNFKYQFLNLEINGLINVKKKFIQNKTKKYLESSIFLLPLDEITNHLKENNWIKNVELKTNYKDTLYVKIDEYRPLGIYSFNGRKFFFDNKGKIIDEIDNQNISSNKFFIFEGQSSNLNAQKIINICDELNIQFKSQIKKFVFIENRRWNIILKKNIRLLLSENFPKKSIENYLKIEKKLSEIEMNNIESIDLRNLKKTIIKYKE